MAEKAATPLLSKRIMVEKPPVRRVRANSIGGSTYDAVNSGAVVRTDARTKEKTLISGREMHNAVDRGVSGGHLHATFLARQVKAHESGRLETRHHPMGCAETRAETAIAAFHMRESPKVPSVRAVDKDGWQLAPGTVDKAKKVAKQQAIKMQTHRAWDNSARSTYSPATNESEKVIPPCENCGRRGHTTSGRRSE